MPLLCPISPASARASCAHVSFLPALRLVGDSVGLHLTILSIWLALQASFIINNELSGSLP